MELARLARENAALRLLSPPKQLDVAAMATQEDGGQGMVPAVCPDEKKPSPHSEGSDKYPCIRWIVAPSDQPLPCAPEIIAPPGGAASSTITRLSRRQL